MKKIDKEISFGELKLKVPINTFETLAEAQKEGGDNAVLAAINDYACPTSEASTLVVKTVQALTEVPFLQIKTKGEDGKIKSTRDFSKDGNSNYVNRALKLKPAVTLEAVQAELNKTTLACSLAPKAPKSVKLSARFTKIANDLLDGKAAQPLTVLQQKLTANGLGTFTANGNREQDVERLGRLCEALQHKLLGL